MGQGRAVKRPLALTFKAISGAILSHFHFRFHFHFHFHFTEPGRAEIFEVSFFDRVQAYTKTLYTAMSGQQDQYIQHLHSTVSRIKQPKSSA